MNHAQSLPTSDFFNSLLGVKLSTVILAEPLVLSAIGASPFA
jgi:hypothetical protein